MSDSSRGPTSRPSLGRAPAARGGRARCEERTARTGAECRDGGGGPGHAVKAQPNVDGSGRRGGSRPAEGVRRPGRSGVRTDDGSVGWASGVPFVTDSHVSRAGDWPGPRAGRRRRPRGRGTECGGGDQGSGRDPRDWPTVREILARTASGPENRPPCRGPRREAGRRARAERDEGARTMAASALDGLGSRSAVAMGVGIVGCRGPGGGRDTVTTPGSSRGGSAADRSNAPLPRGSCTRGGRGGRPRPTWSSGRPVSTGPVRPGAGRGGAQRLFTGRSAARR